MASEFDELWKQVGKSSSSSSSFDSMWEEATVPGMEKLGPLPGVPTVIPPPELATKEQKASITKLVPGGPMSPPIPVDRRTGLPIAPDDSSDPIGIMPQTGMRMIGSGVARMSNPSVDEKLGGVSDVLRGTGTLALPFGAPAMLSSGPNIARTAAGAAAGFAGAKTGEFAAEAVGLGPGASQLTGDLAGIFSAGSGVRGVDKFRARKGVEPETMVVQALKPTVGMVNFKDNLRLSMPELKAAEQRLGRPIAGIADLLGTADNPGAIKIAKAQNREMYKRLTDSAGDLAVDGKSIASAIRSTITKKMKLENPRQAERVELLAKKYERPIPIETAQELLLTTNAELNTYYLKNPNARGVAVRSNPETAILDAQAKSLRDAIYKTLDAPGEGAAARSLQKRYGALLELENAAYRQQNITARQQPDSLSEQLSRWASAGELLRGTSKLATGDVRGGLGDIVGAVAKREVATLVKERQKADALIARAFKKYSNMPEEIIFPVHPPPIVKPESPTYNPSGTGMVVPEGQRHLIPGMYGTQPTQQTSPYGPVNLSGSGVGPLPKEVYVPKTKSNPGVGPVNVPEMTTADVIQQVNTPGTVLYDLFHLQTGSKRPGKPNPYKQPASWAKDSNKKKSN